MSRTWRRQLELRRETLGVGQAGCPCSRVDVGARHRSPLVVVDVDDLVRAAESTIRLRDHVEVAVHGGRSVGRRARRHRCRASRRTRGTSCSRRPGADDETPKERSRSSWAAASPSRGRRLHERARPTTQAHDLGSSARRGARYSSRSRDLQRSLGHGSPVAASLRPGRWRVPRRLRRSSRPIPADAVAGRSLRYDEPLPG